MYLVDLCIYWLHSKVPRYVRIINCFSRDLSWGPATRTSSPWAPSTPSRTRPSGTFRQGSGTAISRQVALSCSLWCDGVDSPGWVPAGDVPALLPVRLYLRVQDEAGQDEDPGRLHPLVLPEPRHQHVRPLADPGIPGGCAGRRGRQDLWPLSPGLCQHRLLQLSVGHPTEAVRHQEHRPHLPLQVWRGCSPASYLVRPGHIRIQEILPRGGAPGISEATC